MPEFGKYVRDGIFWKDTMEAYHGEHSHSIQWLTIATSGIVGNRVAECYRQSMNFRLMTDTKDDKNRELNKSDITLWRWLVDSFPSSMEKDAPEYDLNGSKVKLVSDSYMAPQNVTHQLIINYTELKKHHFLATYLYNRYKNRGWLEIKNETHTVMRVSENTIYSEEIRTQRVVGVQAQQPSGRWKDNLDNKKNTPITIFGVDKVIPIPKSYEWRQENSPSQKGESVDSYKRTGDNLFAAHKDRVKVTFHGTEGEITFLKNQPVQ